MSLSPALDLQREILASISSLTVSLLHEEWCWKEKTAEIEVVDKDVKDISFVQSGYILSCSLSHDIRLVMISNVISAISAHNGPGRWTPDGKKV